MTWILNYIKDTKLINIENYCRVFRKRLFLISHVLVRCANTLILILTLMLNLNIDIDMNININIDINMNIDIGIGINIIILLLYTYLSQYYILILQYQCKYQC